MKKFSIILITILLILGAFISIVYAMTYVPEISVPSAVLSPEKGTVRIKTAESNEWITVSEEKEVAQGDRIKTLEDSQAILNFYDNSQTIIDENTEVSLEELFINEENINQTNVGIKLQIGRVWNRIINLLDKESTFIVSTSSTVATVRGTTFSSMVFADGQEDIVVPDGTVNFYILGKKLQSDIKENNYAKIDPATAEEIIADKTPNEIKQTDWYKGNTEINVAFENDVLVKRQVFEQEQMGAGPDSPLYGLKKVAEKFRIASALGSKEKNELRLNFANRRLVESKELLRQNNTEKAQELLNEYQQGIKELSEDDLSDELINKISQDFIYYQANTGLDSERQQILNDNLEQIQQALEQAKFDLNLISDIKPRMPDISAFEALFEQGIMDEETLNKPEETGDQIKNLQDQLNQQQDKETIDQTIKDLEDFSKTIDQGDETINLLNQTPDSGTPADVEQPADAAEEPVAEIVPVELEIYAPRVNLQAGESVQLTAYLVYSDGTKQDVSSSCSWSMSGENIGTISQTGFLQTAEPGGTATIYASYNYNSESFVASKRITALAIIINGAGEANR